MELRLYRPEDFEVYPEIGTPPVDAVTLPKPSALPEPLPALIAHILAAHDGKYVKSSEYDRSALTMECAYAARRCGLTNDQTYTLLKTRHDPTMGRVMAGLDYDKEFQRIVTQLDVQHPHEGQTCLVSRCPNMSNGDREQAALATALKAAPPSTGVEFDSWLPVDLFNAVNGTVTQIEPQYGIRNDGVCLLYPGKEHVAIGETEAAKTWFMYFIAAYLLCSGKAVTIIDFEDDEVTAASRFLELGVPTETLLNTKLFRYVRPNEPITADKQARLLDNNPALVGFDGVTEAYGLHNWAIKENDDAARFRQMYVKPCLRLGAATLACDHVVKDPSSRGRYAIGGVHKLNGLTGAAFTLENRQPFGRERIGKTAVFISKDRPGYLRRHSVRQDDQDFFGLFVGDATSGRMQLQLEAPNNGGIIADKYDSFKRRICEVIAKNGGTYKGFGNLAAVVGGDRNHVLAALRRLLDDGYLTETTEGQSKLYTLVKNRGDA